VTTIKEVGQLYLTRYIMWDQ